MVSDVFRLLANDRRRAVVAALEDAENDWRSVDELCKQVGTRTNTSPESAAVELHHIHLPQLEDCGVIEYDAASESVRYYHCELVSKVLTAVETSTTDCRLG
ncbi:winged helix-turn-helix domain-containing protein [Halopiger aswanensis]|nr:winged helix-turn-helix domain-containing protein [Halopiger aswanensis]